MKLRSYQSQCIDATMEAFADRRSVLNVLPTGAGKTIIFAHLCGLMTAHGRCMVIAHREELIRQACMKIKAVTGMEPDVEMAEYWADRNLLYPSKIIVSSVQTLNAGMNGEGRMIRFHPEQFSMLVIDEAHHATADTYRKVIAHFSQNPNLKIVGVTATPDRHDEEALGQIFETVGFEYEITDAIRDGWLVSIAQHFVQCDSIDLSAARTTAGDLNQGDLERVMLFEKCLHQVCGPVIDEAGDRRTLVFAASVAHAERMAEIFNRHKPDCARLIHAGTDKDTRRQMLRDYTAGRFQFLCNVGIATEGFDEPGIELIAIARPTKSRALYSQMIGRGTRPLPGIVDAIDDEKCEEEGMVDGPTLRREAIRASRKPRVEILDFVGNSGRHKLVSVTDILGGKISDETAERAKRIIADSGRAMELDEAIRIAAEEDRRAEQARRRSLMAKANYWKREVNPFDVLEVAPRRERGWEKGRQLTDKMAAFLRNQGVGGVDAMTFAQGSQLIGELKERRAKDLCTFKQKKVLMRYGHETEHVTFAKATELINEIAANGWKLPGRPSQTQPEPSQSDAWLAGANT